MGDLQVKEKGQRNPDKWPMTDDEDLRKKPNSEAIFGELFLDILEEMEL